MDPPDHTRLRGLVARAFTPRRIEDLRAATEGITAELIDAMAARLREGGGTVDLIEAFAYPLPVRVICTLLGVPARDEAIFTDWSRGIARSVDPSILRSPEVEAAIVDARQGLQTYLGELLAERRRKPGDDLLSALAAVDVDGDSITAREIVSLAQLLLVAGHETTVNLIGNGMLALLRAPDQLALLRQRPELVGPAVDEFLRFDGPVQINQRVAMEDLDLFGHKVRKGDEILLILGAANRDPAAFAEPHRLDVTRDARKHVAFGGGIHHCLGAVLARMEGRHRLQGAARRLPDDGTGGAAHAAPDLHPARPGDAAGRAMRGAYLQLGSAVFFNVASYLVYKSIADAAPRTLVAGVRDWTDARCRQHLPVCAFDQGDPALRRLSGFHRRQFRRHHPRSGARFPRTPAADSPARHRPRDNGHRSGYEVTCGPRTSLPGSAPVASPSR